MVTMSVVIPAHNERTLIQRLLGDLTSGPLAASLEIVVVPNGCTDDTAAVAASIDPRVVVSSIAMGSKIAALREGDRVATVFPRAYVDADVTVTPETLLALADALRRSSPPLAWWWTRVGPAGRSDSTFACGNSPTTAARDISAQASTLSPKAGEPGSGTGPTSSPTTGSSSNCSCRASG